MQEELDFNERIKKYSLLELEDVRDHINRFKYPDRYELVLNEIKLREAKGEIRKYNQYNEPINMSNSRNGTIRTSNPALNKKTFKDFTVTDSKVMSLQGVINKSGFLITLVVISAALIWTYYFYNQQSDYYFGPKLLVCTLAAFFTALATTSNRRWAIITAPIYAVFEGMALGMISFFFEQMYPGIVIQAVSLTFGTFVSLLIAYSTRLIKPSANFKLGVSSATGGIAIYYLIQMALGYFGYEVTFFNDGGFKGIIISIFVVIVAALNLVLDFDFIEQGVKKGAPKYMEWYSAFALLVTLIWLYLEILRLLSKLAKK